jgi:hypothetical protein
MLPAPAIYSAPMSKHLALAIPAFLLGLMMGSGGCGSSAHEGGTGGGASIAGSSGGSGPTNTGGNGSGGGSGGQPGSGGSSGQSDSGVGVGGNQAGSGGQTGSGGQSGDAGQAGIDGSVADTAQGSDVKPSQDTPPKLDAPVPFWPQAFVPNCVPPAIEGRPQTDGYHRPGEDCMASGCHLEAAKGVPAFLFGGTIYRAGNSTGDSSVQIGVRTPDNFYSACSAANGNFWYISDSSTSALTWSSASVRVRNAGGDSAMITAVAGGCNASLCHNPAFKLISPL